MLKTLRMAGLGVLALGLLAASPVLGQESDDGEPQKKRGKAWTEEQIQALRDGQDATQEQIDTLEAGQKDIQKQLGEIKRLLQQQQQQRQAPKRTGPQVKDVVFNVGRNEIKGASDAKLTLIEFTDYQ
jgi:protein-disulfide isomerase